MLRRERRPTYSRTRSSASGGGGISAVGNRDIRSSEKSSAGPMATGRSASSLLSELTANITRGDRKSSAGYSSPDGLRGTRHSPTKTHSMPALMHASRASCLLPASRSSATSEATLATARERNAMAATAQGDRMEDATDGKLRPSGVLRRGRSWREREETTWTRRRRGACPCAWKG